MALSLSSQVTTTGGQFASETIWTGTQTTWMICVVSWKVIDGTSPLMCVGDSSRNLWTLLYNDSATAFAQNAAASLWTQVWACPNPTYEAFEALYQYVTTATMGMYDTGSFSANTFTISGMANAYLTVDSVTNATANSTTSISITTPTPGANSLMVAVAGADTSAVTTFTGTGWNTLTQASNTSPNVLCVPAWAESATAKTASWSCAVSCNWAATVVAMRVTGTVPTQVNVNWPPLEFQLGLGYTVSNPLTGVTWTTIPNRLGSLDTQRGIQFELGLVQSSPTDLAIRNDDGAFTPRPTYGSGSATATGTTTTLLVANATAANMTVTDFFKLQTSGGVFKENTVFQITGIATDTPSVGTSTVTFQRADLKAGGAQAATASGDVYVACPIDLYIPYRVLASWGSPLSSGKRYPVMTGWVERWPQQWNDPHWGESTAVGIDTIATLTADNLPFLRAEILRRKPHSYWTLSDPSGQNYAQNIGATGIVPLKQLVCVGGLGSGQAQFGTSTTGFVTDSGVSPKQTTTIYTDTGTGWSVSGLTAGDQTSGKGAALIATDTSFPSIVNGVTVLLIFGLDSAGVFPTTAQDITLFVLRTFAGQQTCIKLAYDDNSSSGSTWMQPSVTVWDKSTGAATKNQLGSGQLGGQSFPQVMALTFNQTSWQLFINGNSAGSGTCNLPPSFAVINVGGEADNVASGFCGNGMFAHTAIFPRMLTQGEILQFYYVAAYSGTNYTYTGTNDVIQTRLGDVGWQGSRVLNFTAVQCGLDASASTVAEKITALADQEGGRVFSDASGQLQFRSRDHSYHQVSRATLGDRPDLGEIPFVGDASNFTLDFDPTYIYNSVTVQDVGVLVPTDASPIIINTTTFVAANPSSAQKYGSRTLGKTVSFSDLHWASGLANWLLNEYATPRLRLQQVLIDAAKNSAVWAFVLSVEVGDLVTVNKRPIGAPLISLNCIVLSVKHSVAPNKWETTLILGVAPPTVLEVNSPFRGIVGSNVLGG